MYVLNGTVPYTLNPGNHDLGPNGNAANRDTLLNDYFPSGPIENWTSWGGAFEKGHQENTYHYFSAGGRDWMVVALEFAPRDAVLEWANDIVRSNPDRLVLVVTHNYMVANQRMTTLGGNYGVAASPEGANNGEDIWQKFVKQHRNVMCVFSGHILYEWGWLVSNGVNGNPVYQMMTNFQMNTGGGQGFFRLLTFNMETETVHVETYSPLLDQLRTESEHQFAFDFDLFDHVNDPPVVRRPLDVLRMLEDQPAGYLDLDGNRRPGSGIFFDANVPQGDELRFDIWTGDGWTWVGLGSPVQYGEIGITMMPNGTFRLEAPANWFGAVDLKVRARDIRGGEVNTTVRLEIAAENDPPMIHEPFMWRFGDPKPIVNGDIITCSEDQKLNFWVSGQDLVEPEDPISYSILSSEIEDYGFDSKTGEFLFLPLNEHVGSHLITFGVFDGTDTTSRDIMIKVLNTNDAPMITTDRLEISIEDEPYSFRLEAVDEDPTGDELRWEMETSAEFLSLDERNGVLSGAPRNEDVGTYIVNITVADGEGGSDSIGLTLEVENTNDPPFVNRSPYTLFMDEDTVAFHEIGDWFLDVDDRELDLILDHSGPLSVALLDNGSLRIEPPGDWSGKTVITVEASDGEANATDTLSVVVDNVNDPPLDPKAEIVGEGPFNSSSTIRLSGSAKDADLEYGDALEFHWYSNISGNIGSGPDVELQLVSGKHLITMKVSDRSGAFVHVNLEVFIEDEPRDDAGQDDDGIGPEREDLGKGPLIAISIVALIILLAAVAGIALFLLRRMKGGRSPGSEVKDPAGIGLPEDPNS
ncbi:MAG: tandem-95 repeat protein, partial [Thermoplasmatota archaeon]